MRAIALLLLLAFLLGSACAHAQTTLTGAGGSGGAAGVPYSGPGDVVAGTSGGWWYGLRAFSAGAAAAGTTKAVNVRRASDNATQDILVLTSGKLDATSAASFAGTDATCNASISGTTLTLQSGACSGGTLHVNDPISGVGITQPAYITAIGTCGSNTSGNTCTLNASQSVGTETITAQVALFVVTAYNQMNSGNDATQATTAKQPQLLLSCVNSGLLPCMSFVRSSSQVLSGTHFSGAAANTASMVADHTDSNATSPCTAGSGIAGPLTDIRSANTWVQYTGSFGTNVTANDNVWHAANSTFNNTSPVSVLNIDGIDTNQLSSSGTTSDTNQIGSWDGSINFFNGYISECGVWKTGFSSGNRSSMNSNQHSYWGF